MLLVTLPFCLVYNIFYSIVIILTFYIFSVGNVRCRFLKQILFNIVFNTEWFNCPFHTESEGDPTPDTHEGSIHYNCSW